jgi:hypothetical protein
MPEEQARLAETGMSCFRFMKDAKLWEEQRLRELDVSMYVDNTTVDTPDLYTVFSLSDSYYDDDQSFQALRFKFIGNIEITDIAESIMLYLKKVEGMEQKLWRFLAHHVP